MSQKWGASTRAHMLRNPGTLAAFWTAVAPSRRHVPRLSSSLQKLIWSHCFTDISKFAPYQSIVSTLTITPTHLKVRSVLGKYWGICLRMSLIQPVHLRRFFAPVRSSPKRRLTGEYGVTGVTIHIYIFTSDGHRESVPFFMKFVA